MAADGSSAATSHICESVNTNCPVPLPPPLLLLLLLSSCMVLLQYLFQMQGRRAEHGGGHLSIRSPAGLGIPLAYVGLHTYSEGTPELTSIFVIGHQGRRSLLTGRGRVLETLVVGGPPWISSPLGSLDVCSSRGPRLCFPDLAQSFCYLPPGPEDCSPGNRAIGSLQVDAWLHPHFYDVAAAKMSDLRRHPTVCVRGRRHRPHTNSTR